MRLERLTPEAEYSMAWQTPCAVKFYTTRGNCISQGDEVVQVYLDYACDYGCTLTEKEVLQNFRRAFSSPWTHSLTRYVGDGRPFW